MTDCMMKLSNYVSNHNHLTRRQTKDSLGRLYNHARLKAVSIESRETTISITIRRQLSVKPNHRSTQHAKVRLARLTQTIQPQLSVSTQFKSMGEQANV